MKRLKLHVTLIVLGIVGVILIAADHIDAPSSMNTTADIADYYAFEPTVGSSSTVFAVDLQTNVLPDLAYGTFDENVLTEINIDIDGDLIEDLVIQAIPRNGRMYFFGPSAPSEPGLNGEVLVDYPMGDVEISSTSAITQVAAGGVKLFAGPRQDPFFFDFFQFNAVIGGMAPGGFKVAAEATDTFDGSNTMSIVVELPNAMLGTPTATNVLGIPVYKTWVTTNIKQ